MCVMDAENPYVMIVDRTTESHHVTVVPVTRFIVMNAETHI